MRRFLLGSLVPLSFFACSVEELRWPNDEPGRSDAGAGGDGVGGAAVGGASWNAGGSFTGAGGVYVAVRRGGFEGERTAEVDTPGFDFFCPSTNAIAVYDEARCLAASLCSVPCTDQLRCFFAPPVNQLGACISNGTSNRCVLTCETDDDCVESMSCEATAFGEICLLTETPWTAECAADFQATGGFGGAPDP